MPSSSAREPCVPDGRAWTISSKHRNPDRPPSTSGRLPTLSASLTEASLPPTSEMRAGWMPAWPPSSDQRPKKESDLLEQGLQEPGDTQNRLGFHLGQLGLKGER